uniref:Uncharacterized protein n=1 Tax=Candidatus Kentrum sp. LFY TaxID=2126342 RepID=A0A450UVP7_9GAMM|nr:MAG: hypothetical protein BECKLFY1418B_GA0070995_10875 [Candidatus Kentron sp. LFY]
MLRVLNVALSGCHYHDAGLSCPKDRNALFTHPEFGNMAATPSFESNDIGTLLPVSRRIFPSNTLGEIVFSQCIFGFTVGHGLV